MKSKTGKRCPALRAGQGEFSVLRPFLLPFLFFNHPVRSTHRLNFPYSKPCAVPHLEAGLFKKIRPGKHGSRRDLCGVEIFLKNPAVRCGRA